MGTLHRFPPQLAHAARAATLAGLVTLLMIAALLALPWGSFGPDDRSGSRAASSPSPAVQVQPSKQRPVWATDPLQPVTIR
jgi:hypothetical protein